MMGLSVKITGIFTVNPSLKLSQSQSLKILKRERKLSRRETILYGRFLSDEGIKTRTFAVRKVRDFFVQDQDRLIQRYKKEAVALSVASLKGCLSQSCLRPDQIDALMAVSCTGYLCPGLSSYIVEGARLNPEIHAEDMVGMGCGAALPAIRSAYHFMRSRPGSHAAVLATEICSAALQWDDDPEMILTNSIFGDGSAACLLSDDPSLKGLGIIDFESRIIPKYHDKLCFTVKNSMLRNVIKPDVPKIAAKLVKEIVSELLLRNKISRGKIHFWAVHPGGRKVLDAIESALKLNPSALSDARQVMADYGNMSSPTILYVLKLMIQGKRLKDKDYVVASAFGAGFSGYAVLLQYEDGRAHFKQIKESK